MTFRYEATYSMERWHGVPNNWVECEGIRLESNIALSFIQDMCKALIEAGKPDGSIAFYEDGYADPSYTDQSIVDIVTRMKQPLSARQASDTPSRAAAIKQPQQQNSNMPPVSKATREALAKIKDNPVEWNKLHGRTRSVLLDNGFVTTENDTLEFTELGEAVLTADDAAESYPTNFTKASESEIQAAAKAIGLKRSANLARTLMFIEANIARHSLNELEEKAWKVKVPVKMGRCKSDDMKKRRVLAAISNAGKLAEAL